MKFKTDARELADALRALVPFGLSKKKGLEITGKLEVRSGKLVIYSGDFQRNFYAERTVSAILEKPGTAGLDLQQAISAVGVLDKEIEIDITDGNSGTVRQGKIELPIRGSAETVFKITPNSSNWQTTTQTKALVKAATIANKCRRQDDDPRFELNGIALYPGDNGLELVGIGPGPAVVLKTDLPRLSDSIVLVKPELATAISGFSNKATSIAVEKDFVLLSQDDKLNVISRMENKYPDYKKILDKSPRPGCELGLPTVKKLLQVLNGKVLEPNHHGFIRIYSTGEELILTDKTGGYNYTTNVQMQSELKKSAVNVEHLTKALSLFDDKVTLSFGTYKNRTDIYLTDPDKLVILALDQDYLK